MLIKKREDDRAKHFNDFKAFIEYSNDMNDTYKNIEEHNPNKKLKILIVSDDMVADKLNTKKLNPIVTELFVRSRKIKHFSCFYYTILLCYSKKYWTKFYALLYHENSKQTRISTNCI